MIKIWATESSRAMRPIWTAEEMGLNYELTMMPFPSKSIHERVSRGKYAWNNSLHD